jgi:hypothetical protein
MTSSNFPWFSDDLASTDLHAALAWNEPHREPISRTLSGRMVATSTTMTEIIEVGPRGPRCYRCQSHQIVAVSVKVELTSR